MSNVNDEFTRAMNELERKFNEFDRVVNEVTSKHGSMTSSMGKSGQFSNVQKPSPTTNTTTSTSSSSYTLSLIRMVSNLLDYLRDVISELNCEKIKQAEMNKQLDIHRKLIDGLTTEIIIVKEQNQKIMHDYIEQNANMQAELDQIKVIILSSKLKIKKQNI